MPSLPPALTTGSTCAATLLHLTLCRPSYIAYMVIGGALCILSYLGFLYGKRHILAERQVDHSSSGAGAGPASPCAATRTRWQRWMPFLFSMYAALLGTQSVIYGKTLAVLLRTTLQGESQVDNWYTWFSLFIFILAAIWWGTRYNQVGKLGGVGELALGVVGSAGGGALGLGGAALAGWGLPRWDWEIGRASGRERV